jgi:hypothetical protein
MFRACSQVVHQCTALHVIHYMYATTADHAVYLLLRQVPVVGMCRLNQLTSAWSALC